MAVYAGDRYAGCTCGCDYCNGPLSATPEGHCGRINCSGDAERSIREDPTL